MKNDFIIIASGCSATQDDIDYIHARKNKFTTIVINDNYKRAPWADYLYYCDFQWYKWHRQGIEDFGGIVATCSKGAADWHFNIGRQAGLSFKPCTLNQGKNSGYQAINLACLMGARNIYLVGYDMKRGACGRKHWFGEHPIKGRDLWDDFISMYDTMIADLKAFDVRVINCNPDSALECFPKVELRKAFL